MSLTAMLFKSQLQFEVLIVNEIIAKLFCLGRDVR